MKFSHSLLRSGLALALALTVSPSLSAQQPAAETLQQRANQPISSAPISTPEESSNKDLGDVGVVQKFPKPEMFTFSTSQQAFYTDNVFYTNSGEVGSFAYLGNYTASFVPYSLRDWTPRISLQYNMARYDRAAAGDFDNENLVLSSTYVFTEDRKWSWRAAVDLSRFTAPHMDDNEFYKEVIYDNQITYIEPLLKDTPLFFVGVYDIAYHQSSPAIYDRIDNTLILSLLYYPIPEISISPYVRPGARNYTTDGPGQSDRSDFNLSEGIDITWKPIKYFALSTNITHSDDYSSSAGQSYSNTIPGVSVTGTIKF